MMQAGLDASQVLNKAVDAQRHLRTTYGITNMDPKRLQRSLKPPKHHGISDPAACVEVLLGMQVVSPPPSSSSSSSSSLSHTLHTLALHCELYTPSCTRPSPCSPTHSLTSCPSASQQAARDDGHILELIEVEADVYNARREELAKNQYILRYKRQHGPKAIPPRFDREKAGFETHPSRDESGTLLLYIIGYYFMPGFIRRNLSQFQPVSAMDCAFSKSVGFRGTFYIESTLDADR